MISPVASTTVVINGPEMTAGSTPRRLASKGNSPPAKDAQVQMATRVTATTTPRSRPYRSEMITKLTLPSAKPSNSPILSSRCKILDRSENRTSPTAIARMTSVEA